MTEAEQQALVRNGYLPKREFQRSLEYISVRLPELSDRSGYGRKELSRLIIRETETFWI